MSLLPFSKQLQKLKYTLNKISFLSGLSFKNQLSIVSLILLVFIIPLTVLGIKTINDLRGRAAVNCSVTATWPANPNRPIDCQQSLTVSWGSPGFAVALAKDGALVAASPQLTGTSYTFSGLQANALYHYVICAPNCGVGTKIKEGDTYSSGSGTLTVSWYYTIRLTEAGNFGATVATNTSSGTSITFTGLQPDHAYDYYVCTLDCGTGVLVTSGTARTAVCPITYKVKLTNQGNAGDVIAQVNRPEGITSHKFTNSNIKANTTYDYYVYSPATATTVYHQGSATSDSACATQNSPGPPTLNQPKGTGSFSNPTFSWNSVTNATYYKVLVKPGDNNFNAGGFWFKQTTAASLPWNNGSGWSSNNIGVPSSTFSPGITYWWLAWSCNDSTGGCSLGGAAAPVSFGVIGEPSIINDLTMSFKSATSAIFTWTWTGNCATEQLTVGTDGSSYAAILNSAVKSDDINICTTAIPKHTMNFTNALTAGKTYYAVITVSLPPVQASNIASATVPAGVQAPLPPTLNQPKGTGSFSNPTFSWNSVTNATYYKVLVKPGDNNFNAGGFWFKQTTAASLPWNNGSGWSSNNIGVPSSTFSPGITYWWLAWSCNDSTGGCSLGGAAAPVSFGVSGGGITCNIPGGFSLKSPLGPSVDSRKPNFTWNSSSGAGAYWVDITDDSSFTNWWYYFVGSATQTVFWPTWTASNPNVKPVPADFNTNGLTLDKSYYWRVSARQSQDCPGDKSVFSKLPNPVIKFVSVQAPFPPTLNQPKGTGSFSNPTFSWNSVTNATYYKVLVKPGDNNFNAGGFWFKQTTAASLPWNNGSGWSSNNIGVPSSTFSPGITYWWLAWSCNDSTGGCSLGGAAAPVSFGVSGGAVACDRLKSDLYIINPADKKVLDQNKPSFSWSEYAGLGDSYWVDLSEQPFGTPGEWWWFSGPHVDVPKISWPATWNTSLAAGHVPPNNGLREGIVYYWRVSARHPNCPGFIKFSNSVNSFAFKPSVVGLLPATNLTESTGPCKVKGKVEVTFKWVPSISPGATEQWLDFSTKEDFLPYFNAKQESTTTSSYTLKDIMNCETIYYWRVKTKFNSGESKQSIIKSFETPGRATSLSAQPPSGIKVLERVCNENDDFTSVKLGWTVTSDIKVVNVILYEGANETPKHNTNVATPENTIKYSDLISNTHFKAYLYAINSSGVSSVAGTIEFDSPNCPGRFNLYSSLPVCETNGTVTVTFSWGGSKGAQGYVVDLSTDPNPATRWQTGHFINNAGQSDRVPGATTYTWKGIKSNVQHWWRVYAYIGEFGRHSNVNGTFKKDCRVPLPHEDLGIPNSEKIEGFIYLVAGNATEPISGRNLADVMIEIVIGESYFDLCAVGRDGEIGIFGFTKSLWIGSGFWRRGIDSGSGFRNGPKIPPCWTIPGEDEPFHSVEWLRPPEPWSPLDGNLWDPYDQILGATKIISAGGACNWTTYKMNNGYWRCG